MLKEQGIALKVDEDVGFQFFVMRKEQGLDIADVMNSHVKRTIESEEELIREQQV